MSVGLVYLVAISLVGLLLLAVVWDAVASVSQKQAWPDIRMHAQRVQTDVSGDQAVAALREAQRKADRAAAVPAKVVEQGPRAARNDEVAEAA
jgi:hypothetical protein